ncbi:ABC transporter permease [Actinomadura viridis]|uniref:ABC transporter permease n=1 Tax=Actinomadura viridis TaxID=58110 RepID=A0A931DCB3_9ACTN|nr:ABC transporter permease [Actinomadura viridis]MBG6086407.1 hypothetical protein [Actinomadura viridis]
MTPAMGAQARRGSRSATFADAVRSEWTKIRTVRSTAYTLLGTVVLGVGAGALISLARGRQYGAATAEEQAAFDPAAVGLSGYILAQCAIGVLGVLVVTSEYATGMIGTSLAVVPGRSRLLAAKSAVFAMVALATGTITGFAAFLVGQRLLAGHGAPHMTLGDPQALRAVFGAGLYLALVGLFGVAAGTLLRATAGAFAVVVAVTFLVPAFIPVLPGSWARPMGRFWPTMAGRQIMAVHQDPALLAPWAGFGVMCAVVLVVLAAAFAVFRIRDV